MEKFDERLDEQWRARKGPRVNNEEPSASIFLDPWLTAKGDPLAALVDHLMSITMPTSPTRTRSLRRDAAERRRFVMGNIAANLAHLALSPCREPGNLLAISTAKTKPTRYDRKDYPQGILKGAVQSLQEAGMLVVHPYVFRQRTTTVEPTAEFIALMHRHGVRLGDIGRDTGGETIWLRARDDQEKDEPRRRQHAPLGKHLVPYADTEETIRLRAEMEHINTILNDAGIAYAGEPIGPLALRRSFLLRSPHSPQAFDLNGRIAGGFWQTLKTRRRYLISIGGEDIADLDYVSAFAVLAYLRATGSLPDGDPYDIPGLEEHRDGAKLAMISLLSRKGDMRLLAPKLKAALPEGWTARRLVEAMMLRHPAIAHLFGRDVGVELMHTESRVLMAVLLELADRGIPALPVHDGINVRGSDREEAVDVMQSVSAKLLGVALPVKEKPIWRPQVALAA